MRRCIFLVLLLLLTAAALGEGTEIVISFTGDCTLGSEERTRLQPTSFDTHIVNHGFGYPFEQVQSILAHDDLTVINLENVFYPHDANRVEKTYNFRGPVEFADILLAGSIELSYLGNNHTLDYGLPGFKSTVETLEGLGLDWFALTEASDKTYIFEKNGIKVGFTGAYASYWGQDTSRMRRSIQALKDAGCDFIVGVMHGGAEYSPRQGRGQERMAKSMIDQGVGFVAGHHPHVLQGVEVYGDANIVYSLGNFSFGGNAALRATDTMIAQLTLRFDAEGRYLGQQLNLIPAHVSGTLEYNNFQPVLVQGQTAQAILDTVQKVSTYPLKPCRDGVGAVQDFLPAGSPKPLVREAE